MPLFVLTVIIQACFIFHVFKTGRPYWWAFIILSFPGIGCVVYYLVEVFPNSREHRAANRASRGLARALDPGKELRERREAMEIAPTVGNRMALAEALLRHDRAGEAVALYREARTGPHAEDAEVMLGLARACMANGDFAQTRAVLDELVARHPDFRVDAVALLTARALEAQGDLAGALDRYERVAATHVGVEAKVRYGQLLKKMGHLDQARTVLGDVVQHAKRFKIAHEEERAWVEIARHELG